MISLLDGSSANDCIIREYTTFQYIRRAGRARSKLDETEFHDLCNESFLLGYLTLSTFIHTIPYYFAIDPASTCLLAKSGQVWRHACMQVSKLH